MEEQKDDKLTCQVCGKNFCTVSSKNRHLKHFHNIFPNKIGKHHIKCPLCSESTRVPFRTRKDLISHLKQFHTLDIIESDSYFRTIEEFEAWRNLENRDINYACQGKEKLNDHCELYTYNCNRSDTTGFVSKCPKRTMKKGGSIKISGMCPSKIQAKIDSIDGVNVHFVETHVGHENKLISKRLRKSEEEMVEGVHEMASNDSDNETSSQKDGENNENKCLYCEKTVVKCVKCSNNFHESCLTKAGNLKNAKCEHEKLSLTEKEVSMVMKNKLLEMENSYLKQLMKEMTEKYQVLMQNNSFLTEKIKLWEGRNKNDECYSQALKKN